MLKMSDTPIIDKIAAFTNLGIHVAFLVPTPTGYKKSIMDATYGVRDLLLQKGFHNYSLQLQGPDNKVLKKAFFILPDSLKETQASLYRPITKQGDPRIWFYDLKSYCVPCNLLALFIHDDSIYVINLSDAKIFQSFQTGYIHSFLINIFQRKHQIVFELRDKIQLIHDSGFLKSITVGDPGVGDTLEHALGIRRNPSKKPDYKGIELKAYRGEFNGNRSTMFDQKPDWDNSPYKSSTQLIDKFGHWNDQKQRFDLHCTINYSEARRNTQGLYNELDLETNVLKTYCSLPPYPIFPVAQWDLDVLKERLLQKHPETFWVKATSKHEGDTEYFRYDHILYTRNPNVSVFVDLIEEGAITIDFLITKTQDRTKDKGYPFKIKKKYLYSLFPTTYSFDLANRVYDEIS